MRKIVSSLPVSVATGDTPRSIAIETSAAGQIEYNGQDGTIVSLGAKIKRLTSRKCRTSMMFHRDGEDWKWKSRYSQVAKRKRQYSIRGHGKWYTAKLQSYTESALATTHTLYFPHVVRRDSNGRLAIGFDRRTRQGTGRRTVPTCYRSRERIRAGLNRS